VVNGRCCINRANTSWPWFIDHPREVVLRRVAEPAFAVQIETKKFIAFGLLINTLQTIQIQTLGHYWGELTKQADSVSTGNLERPEAMLSSQAHTLDAIFNNLARRALSTPMSIRMLATCTSGLRSRRRANAGRHQAELIRNWRPWERSTGPKTAAGKARASRNTDKGRTRPLLRELARALRRLRSDCANGARD